VSLNEKLITELSEILNSDQILTEEEDVRVYGYDGTAILNEKPACVIFPENSEQIQTILTKANRFEIPVVTRGSGTGLSGGSIPVANGIVICMVRMNRILEVDEKNMVMEVEPGVLTQQIADQATLVGLFYPPDPGSIKISTIGGNIANNSGGLRGLKYGVTRDYVMALEVVLPDGRILKTGTRCVKDVAGYSLKDLFVGSEGMLGIITKITLKLIPKPSAKKTMLVLFDSMTEAAEAVSLIIENKIIPCTLEFLDRVTIECVEEYAGIGLPTDCEAVLLAEVDGHSAEVADTADQIVSLVRSKGAREVRIAESESEALGLASARRTAFSALARLAPTVVLEDVTVPRSKLAEMVQYINDVATRYNLRVGTFGHMGDGNLHPTFLCDERNEEEMHRVEEAMSLVFGHAISLGGTITGEHGVGLAKKPFLPGQLGEIGIEVMRQVKHAFDPNGILNPGKVFD
jgi:glycolate oxidase